MCSHWPRSLEKCLDESNAEAGWRPPPVSTTSTHTMPRQQPPVLPLPPPLRNQQPRRANASTNCSKSSRPERPAPWRLTFGSKRMTYAELNRRADLAARKLRALGVGPDVPVGLCLERTAEIVTSVLAI